MTSLDTTIKKCCVSDPVWIFIYSDGSIFAICKEDFSNSVYQSGVEEVINIESQESFTPQKIFGN